MHENDIGTEIVKAAVDLHRDLGPGLLELVYEATLTKKLRSRGLAVWRQVPIAIEYNGTMSLRDLRASVRSRSPAPGQKPNRNSQEPTCGERCARSSPFCS